jgi:hypothetical protein
MTESLHPWVPIAVAGGLTLALRVVPLMTRRFLRGTPSPALERFNRVFMACCMSTLVVATLWPSGAWSPGELRRVILMAATLAAYLVVRRVHDGLLLVPAMALLYVAVLSFLS